MTNNLKPLYELGYLEKGMTIIDPNGKRATITKLGSMEGMPLVHFNDDPNPVMWDWDRLIPDVMAEVAE
ncbi:hypothetical protein [Lederbergia galactosidilytica]|uniref:Uncharacterized protein n=1 Tax=Lederbergia galactosidilytica TaxID=217031 RepID=A0A177ZT99_9BACI|nr:hypothetical protein [Lederbergia galactosidilytica]OAK70068.1 hypothetical protein ABB05_12860 [Lederbergia galactosidilytica]